MATKTLTLTQADVDGFRRVCQLLWQGRGRGPGLDIEDVSEYDRVVTFVYQGNPDDPITGVSLVGASVDLEIPDGPF